MLKQKVFGAAYRNLFKPLAFQLDAEWIHNAITVVGENLEILDPIVSAIFAYNDPRLTKWSEGKKEGLLLAYDPSNAAQQSSQEARLTAVRFWGTSREIDSTARTRQ